MRKHGESSLILSVLTRGHGKVTGFVKNCLSKKSSCLSAGNQLKIEAYARVDDNMLELAYRVNHTLCGQLFRRRKQTSYADIALLPAECLPA
ncbi:MAG: recombination protein O N-terminal domain-containing protein [Alphaproteobacteria bacterium]